MVDGVFRAGWKDRALEAKYTKGTFSFKTTIPIGVRGERSDALKCLAKKVVRHGIFFVWLFGSFPC